MFQVLWVLYASQSLFPWNLFQILWLEFVAGLFFINPWQGALLIRATRKEVVLVHFSGKQKTEKRRGCWWQPAFVYGPRFSKRSLTAPRLSAVSRVCSRTQSQQRLRAASLAALQLPPEPRDCSPRSSVLLNDPRHNPLWNWESASQP